MFDITSDKEMDKEIVSKECVYTKKTPIGEYNIVVRGFISYHSGNSDVVARAKYDDEEYRLDLGYDKSDLIIQDEDKPSYDGKPVDGFSIPHGVGDEISSLLYEFEVEADEIAVERLEGKDLWFDVRERTRKHGTHRTTYSTDTVLTLSPGRRLVGEEEQIVAALRELCETYSEFYAWGSPDEYILVPDGLAVEDGDSVSLESVVNAIGGNFEQKLAAKKEAKKKQQRVTEIKEEFPLLYTFDFTPGDFEGAMKAAEEEGEEKEIAQKTEMECERPDCSLNIVRAVATPDGDVDIFTDHTF